MAIEKAHSGQVDNPRDDKMMEDGVFEIEKLGPGILFDGVKDMPLIPLADDVDLAVADEDIQDPPEGLPNGIGA